MPALRDVPKVPAHKERPQVPATFTDKLQPPAEIIEQPVQKHERTPPRLY